MSKDYKNSNIKYKFFGELADEIIDEEGSMYIAIRKTAWYSSDKEPTEEKAKLEIRKWKVSEGDEPDFPNKGIRFLTEEGPHNLVHTLVKNGYGNTKKILRDLKQRKDFKEAVQTMYEDDDTNSEGFFDAREDLLLEA